VGLTGQPTPSPRMLRLRSRLPVWTWAHAAGPVPVYTSGVPDLIPSGRFAQLARLSRKALRLYAELHLLRPVYVGADNGYWYYRLGQLDDAARISKLRDLGMSLDMIRVVLRAWITPALKAHLEAHRHTLLAQAAEVAVTALESLFEAPPQTYPVSCKAVAAQAYLGRRAWTAPAEACGFIERVYHDEGEEAWDIEVCVPVGVYGAHRRLRRRSGHGRRVRLGVAVGARPWAPAPGRPGRDLLVRRIKYRPGGGLPHRDRLDAAARLRCRARTATWSDQQHARRANDARPDKGAPHATSSWK
jgi:DNA-binding transcriptional MerR regulator